jgi:hypothetical protein
MTEDLVNDITRLKDLVIFVCNRRRGKHQVDITSNYNDRELVIVVKSTSMSLCRELAEDENIDGISMCFEKKGGGISETNGLCVVTLYFELLEGLQ